MVFFAPTPWAILNKENTHEITHGLQLQLLLEQDHSLRSLVVTE